MTPVEEQLDVPVTFTQLFDGTELSVPVKGQVERVKVPPRTPALQQLRLTAMGVVLRLTPRSAPLQPGEKVRAGPRWYDYLALPLFLPVGVYGMYVLVSSVNERPMFTDPLVLNGGLALGAVLMVASLFSTLRTRYWRLDERGLSRGLVLALHLPWAELEGAVLGTPSDPLTIVLRLSGRRLFRLPPRRYRERLVLRLLDVLGERVAFPNSYSPEERRTLERWRGDGVREAM